MIITGGCGQLGRQMTGALLSCGAKVAVFDVAPTRESKDNLLMLTVDVTRRDSIETGLREVISRWGAPHGLINNAALDAPPNAPAEETGPFETYPESSWDKVMQVNTKGVFLCCQVIGGAMAAAGRGSIVNVSSIYGLVSPNQSIYEYRGEETGTPFVKPVAYSVSKSALFNLTRYLATYWAKKNVRVNTVTFGGVFNQQDPKFLENYCSRVPLGRMARDDEYNGVIIFLMSDASSYMTGSNIVIDGGWTAW
ncbi:MAG TPA: SDR family oxidoreductase [Pyrinomonadaceae bacterium]|nr:SDR family oxidoreductase [Pyrinomonadaceae bacterium]